MIIKTIRNMDALCESNEALIINKALLNKDGDLTSAMVTLCKAVISCCDQVQMEEMVELSNHLTKQIAKVVCGFVARDARFLIG